MNIAIIGHGYVGLVTAVVFADLGNTVRVIGRDKKKIDQLRFGKPTFYEPGLEEMLKRNLAAKRIIFTLDYKEAIFPSEVVFIGVGTPPKENGEADLTNVLKVAESIGKHINNYTVVACKSTVPVGTNRKIKDIILKLGVPKAKFDIASCPEFLREGTALSDTLHPDRVVIGTENPKAEKVLVAFHKPIGGARILTTIETAEMIKYASNALLATKVSFANMLAFLCEEVGADVEKVLTGVGIDRRLGRSFLYPGAGYGGSCLPKDVKALVKVGQAHGANMGLLEEVEKINTEASRRIASKIIKALGSGTGKTLGVLGLSFKPNTDDMREAPSVKILKMVREKLPTLTIKVYDPIVKSVPEKSLGNMIYSTDAYEAVTGAHAMALMTEWNEFRQLDLQKVQKLMKKSVIIDGRNIFDPHTAADYGFTYYGVGRTSGNT